MADYNIITPVSEQDFVPPAALSPFEVSARCVRERPWFGLLDPCAFPPACAWISFDKPSLDIYNVIMGLEFDWGKAKSTANRRKHGISFEEAQTVFLDEHALIIHDPDHSDDEDRFIILGLSVQFRALVVCHCYRKKDETIRFISARKATRTEQKRYWER